MDAFLFAQSVRGRMIQRATGLAFAGGFLAVLAPIGVTLGYIWAALLAGIAALTASQSADTMLRRSGVGRPYRYALWGLAAGGLAAVVAVMVWWSASAPANLAKQHPVRHAAAAAAGIQAPPPPTRLGSETR